jgi:hypothetical protein
MPLSVGYFDGVNRSLEEDDSEGATQLGASTSSAELPERVVTRFAPDGISKTDGPRVFRNEVGGPLRNLRSVRWSVQLDQGLTKDLTMRIGYLQRASRNELTILPQTNASGTSMVVLSSTGHSRYRELQLLSIYNNRKWGYWNASYTWSSAQGDLNTADNYLGDFPAFVIRPDQYGPLPFDVPHRFLLYGELKMPSEITISPSVEVRSGFPFSRVNEQLDFVGLRNRAGRFPSFLSLDVQVTKSFRVPMFEKHKVRIGAAVFNITNHFNPRDVQNNITSPRLGQFFNGLGTSIRGKFEVDF